VILKVVKVVCFDDLLQVFILGGIGVNNNWREDLRREAAGAAKGGKKSS
jgi:hypothetical protein